MAKFKCSDGIYTVLRNGKVVAGGATAGEAIVAISADAGEVACCSIEITGIEVIEDEFYFNINALGTSVQITYVSDFITEPFGCLPITDLLHIGVLAEVLFNTDPVTISVNSSVDGCRTFCATQTFSKYLRETTIPDVGAATVVPVPAGTPACTGVISYASVYTTLVGSTLNATTGAVTIPAQVIASTKYYSYIKLCDGLIIGILVLAISNP